ncbi:MAG: PilZ domain-containing protein [Bacteriovorax sp.]|nr:PilZ domain-containing protein [Bacteriovorax sp.]
MDNLIFIGLLLMGNVWPKATQFCKQLSKRFKQALFSQLPLSLKGRLIKRSIKIPSDIASNISFKIANTEVDLENAYRILHDAYVEQTFITPQKTGMRIISHYALPTTTTVVGKFDDNVVGTLSIIKSGALGIPMENYFDISKFQNSNSTYAEISSLAIKKEFRRDLGGVVFFPLLKYVFNYCTDFFNVENLLIVVHPKDEVFYKELLFFENIPNTGVVDYMGVPAIALYVNLPKAMGQFKDAIKKKNSNHLLSSFFAEASFSNLNFPNRKFQTTNDSILNKEIFNSLFIEKGNFFENISLKDYTKLKCLFTHTSIAHVFNKNFDQGIIARAHHRYNVKMKGQDIDSGNEFIVNDVSTKGLQLKSHLNFESGKIYELVISVNSDIKIKIEAIVVSINQTAYGFQIISKNEDWFSFINLLHQDHFIKVAV